MSETFEITQKFEGLWKVTWPGLGNTKRNVLLANIISIAFSITNDEVGFSTSDGERAYTIYLRPEAYWQKSITDGIGIGNVKCCMFHSEREAELFVEAISKTLTWYSLTDVLKKEF